MVILKPKSQKLKYSSNDIAKGMPDCRQPLHYNEKEILLHGLLQHFLFLNIYLVYESYLNLFQFFNIVMILLHYMSSRALDNVPKIM